MPNRLATQSSPYLLQHAHQPVDWYPWGDEALQRAQREDKPILLSIGYAACHWCHVMARESFDNASTAALMNEHFISIKVDREERPDLDQLYQTAHQILRRNPGGWPLTIFLSPQGVPFYSGTYFPHTAQQGRPAFDEVLGAVATAWREQRPALATQDQALLAAFQSRVPQPDASVVIDAAVRDQACQRLAEAFDAEHGGFGGAPKFPHPTDLAFLLSRGSAEGDDNALHMALHSLRKMAEGGLYDQIGGGFFRYSTDVQWHIPHFEKMLYDNGVLLGLYAQALAATGEPLFRRVVEDTAAWALREMQAGNGGFHASLAADDGQGHEGSYYLWQSEPLRLALSPNEWDVCAAHWGLIDPPSRLKGRSAPSGGSEPSELGGPMSDPPGFAARDWHLHIARPAEGLAQTLRRPLEMVEELIATARPKLLAERDKRPHPARDDKLLTGWNALMITGLAQAGAVCARADWLQAARRALDWLRSERRVEGQPCGQLQALPGQPAFLDDHAFLLEAVLALHAADPQPGDLDWAHDIAHALLTQFEDPLLGGFFYTRHDAPALIHRQKTGIDAATPSGNGTAALALQALGRLTNEVPYFAAADRCVRVFATALRDDPASHSRLLQAALSA